MGGNPAYGQKLAGKRGVDAARKSLHRLRKNKPMYTYTNNQVKDEKGNLFNISGPHLWKEGQRIEEGVDFKFNLAIECGDVSKEYDVVTPLPSVTNNTKNMTTENYEPYGPEWEKEMMKWRKQDLIKFARDQAMKRKELEGEVNRLNSIAIKMAELGDWVFTGGARPLKSGYYTTLDTALQKREDYWDAEDRCWFIDSFSKTPTPFLSYWKAHYLAQIERTESPDTKINSPVTKEV